MKGKKITNIRTHIGITQFAGQQTLEITRLKNGSMELNALGVLVKATQGAHDKQVLVPFSNITHIEMVDDKEEEKPKK